MLLGKYEGLLQLSVKPLVIQLSLVSSISIGQTMCDVWKSVASMLVDIFRVQ